MKTSRSPKTNLFLLSLAIPWLAVLLQACGPEMENGSETIDSVELAISSIAPPMLSGQTFWGSGGLKEFPAITAADCYTPCFNDTSCSGGTFNPDKQYCWLRTGSGAVSAGLVSDSAFTMTPDLRNSYSQALMSAGQSFWGTGGVREFSTPNAADCYLACVNDASCSGGTFNPAKQYCWLRGGEGSVGAGLNTDYAFRMAPDMSNLNAVVQRYSPVVVLHPSETYMPDNVQHYMQNVELHVGLLLSGEADSDYDTFNLLSLGYYPTMLTQGLTASASSLRNNVNDYVTSSNRFRWSSSGPIAGMTCTQITEGADPYTWNDNYFCNDIGIQFFWSSSGPVPGKKKCIQINEPADPHTWNDNYLCTDSEVEFQWSFAGPIAGMNCTSWNEGADPHGWTDNYLCNKPLSNYTKVWTQIPADKDSLKNGNVAAAKSYVALEQAAGSNELKIQYWYFYPYNGPGRVEICASGLICDNIQLGAVGRHEGDWEHVDVVVNTQTGGVVSLFLSQHDGGGNIGTSQLQSIQWLGGRHPVVYSGYYSHAFYPSAGRHEYERAASYDYGIGTASVDLYDLTGEGTRFSVNSPAQYQVVSASVPGLQVTKPEWASYSDRWGKYEKTAQTFVINYVFGSYSYTQKMIGTGPYKSF